jgi:hypothetical protein
MRRLNSVIRILLLVAEREQRIDSSGLSRRQKASGQPNRDDEYRHDNERHGVGRRYTGNSADQNAGKGVSGDKPHGAACRHEPEALQITMRRI